MKRSGATGQLLVAIGVLVLSAVAAYQTTVIPVSPLYAKVGPTIFPWIVSAGLAFLGAALLIEALRGGWTHEAELQGPIDRHALGWVLAGLVLNVALIKFLGFIIASTLMFCCVARGFGSTRPLRDAGIAIVFAAITYFGFARLLGINIGGGLLEQLF
jgi:putative tricarboxylic transport membrane protein